MSHKNRFMYENDKLRDGFSSVWETIISINEDNGSRTVEKKLQDNFILYYCSRADMSASNTLIHDLKSCIIVDPLQKSEKSKFRQFVKGCSLSEYFSKNKIIRKNMNHSYEAQMIIAYVICKSIMNLHNNREFHGNIKLNNIIIQYNLYPVLCDAIPPEIFSFLSIHGYSSNINKAETNGELYDIYSLGLILKELFSINDMISKDSKLSFIIESCFRKIPKHRPSIHIILNCLEDFSLRSSFDQMKFSFYVNEISKAEGIVIDQDIHSNIYSLRNSWRKFELFHFANTLSSNKDCQIIVSYYNIERNHFLPEDLRILEENCSQNIYAAYYMSNCLMDGHGFEKDEERAFQLLIDYLSKAQHESSFHPVILTLLGLCYELGVGTEVNKSEAFRYYELSANRGYSSGQSNLGNCYEEGTGTRVVQEKTFLYYALATKQGNKYGYSNLANCYEEGIGTEVDLEKAFHYYELAAQFGHEHSMSCLARCYEEGIGTEVDHEKAFHYYELAVQFGDKRALSSLAFCYEVGIGTKVDMYKAFYYLEQSANLGDPGDLSALGSYYQYGLGTEKNVEKAIHMHKMSKFPLSCLELGNIYHKEENFIDYEKALKYLRLSKIKCHEARDIILSLQNSIIPN